MKIKYLQIDKILVKIRKFILGKKNDGTIRQKIKKLGLIRLGYKINFDKPCTFNEKLNWYKLNYYNKMMVRCTDKFSVRKYIKEKNLEDILVPCHGLYNSLEEIDLSSLPEQFVAKVTGDSGGVVVCKDKNLFYNMAINKLDCLDKSYAKEKGEWQYQQIDNKIIVESLIETEDGHSPKDYKFFCFNGEPKFLFVASERDTDVKFDFFDLDWNHIPVIQGHYNSKKKIEKPEKLEEMLEICRILSKDFPHVRVDLYYERGKIYFGELTFFHYSGLTPFHPKKYDYIFGKYFDISDIK